ncbi:hypothetical protein [Sphingobium sp. Leaf26]|uniref:hypothetical protein n=1 Tax=Sphingobium sp. Leaf26 TaxID=1735693 RepID=UPI0012E106B9|nr:hypothetical protein [Sphingobium sp. Leaf26]
MKRSNLTFCALVSSTLRGRNLTDAFYGEYSGCPSTNIYIGAPRSVEISLATHF